MPYIGQGLTEGRRRAHNFVATAGQTTFSATYDAGFIDVYQNGILLTASDYTATNGNTVVLGVGASANDEITIIAHQIFSISDTVSAGQGGSFGGAIDVTGNITTTGSLRGPSSFTIDPATHGDNTGTVVIAGDLTVNGTTTTINSTTLTVDDKNIIIASGTSNSSTADGSGLTIDLGSDGTATMTYTHATTSIDFNKDIKSTGAKFADNAEARFGTGEDLRIFHDGTNNIIRGMARPTWIQTDNTIFLTKNAASETMAKFIGDGAVELYHNNVKKFETTSDGIDITGDLTLTSTDAGSGVDPTLTLYRNSASPNSWDSTGEIVFKGRNDASQDVEYSRINGMIEDKTDGTENGRIQFWNMRNGTLQESIYLDSWGNLHFKGDNARIIWNDLNGTTYDAYLGWNNLTAQRNINFPDADGTLVIADSSGNVGIGTDNPSALQQNYIDSGSANLALRLTQNNSGQGIWMEFQPGNNTDDWQIGANSAGLAIYNATDSRYDMVIKNDGNVGIGTQSPEYPLQVSGANVTSGGGSATLGIYDTGTAYNGTNPGGGIAFRGKYNNGGSLTNFATVQGVKENTTDGNYATALRFTTRANGGNLSEKMRIDSSGNVGIGMTPSGYLTNGYNLRLYGGTQTYLAFNNSTHTTQVLGGFVIGNDAGAARITQRENQPIIIATNDTTAMTISNTGNVGIGVASPAEPLDVQGADSGIIVRSAVANRPKITLINGTTGMLTLSANGTYAAIGDGTDANRYMSFKDGYIGIGTTNPSADLHVEKGSNGNSGHFKMGHSRQRRGSVGISSSQSRWYKVMNYASGEIFTGVAQLFHQRGGGYNQTGAYRTYNMSVAGYNNGIYGPSNATGDSGEGGNGTLEFGSDEALYLRVNSSVYGGSIYFTFTGTGNGVSGGWAFNSSSYSTSLP